MRHVNTFDRPPEIGQMAHGSILGITKRGRIFYHKRFSALYLGEATMRGERVHTFKQAIVGGTPFASLDLAVAKFVTGESVVEMLSG